MALIETISSINKTGEDYATLTLWEDDKDGDLTSGDGRREIGEVYADDGLLDDMLDMNGSTTSATQYLEATSASEDRHSGIWDATKSRIVPTSDGTVNQINDWYCRVSWLQVYPKSGAANSMGIFTGAVDYPQIHHNIVDGHENAFSSGIYVSSEQSEVYRNIVYDCERDINGNIHDASVDENFVYYNTVFRGTNGILGNANTIIIGNAVFDCTTNFDTGVAGSGYNASNDDTAPGSNNQDNKDSADQFVSETGGSEDLRLKAGADCLLNGEAVVGSVSPYNIGIQSNTVEVGIEDIGADQLSTTPAFTERIGHYVGDMTVLGVLSNCWQKIGEGDLGAPASSFTLAGLSGDTDVLYNLILRNIDASTIGDHKLTFNADTGANYGMQELVGSTTTASALRTTGGSFIKVGETKTDDYTSFSDTFIYAPANRVRTLLTTLASDITGATVGEIAFIGGVWQDTTTSISQIVVTATADNFEANTHYELWRLNL